MEIFVGLIAVVGYVFFFIVIPVIIIRWVLRINKIIELLEQISEKLPNRPSINLLPPIPALHTKACGCCYQEFPVSELSEIHSIGKTVCPSCKKFLLSKKPGDRQISTFSKIIILSLLLFLSSRAGAVIADANILNQLRFLKADKIAQLIADCNNAEKELARYVRAPIKPYRKQASRKDVLMDIPPNPVQRKDPAKEKRAVIDDLRAKTQVLQRRIALVEANDLNLIVPVFETPFRIGDIGRLGDVHYGGRGQDFTHQQRFRIISIFSGDESLVEFEISAYFTRHNDIGMGVGPGEILSKNVCLRGVSTAGLITGSPIKPPPFLIITGTQDYFTPVGAKQTVFVFEPLEIPVNF
jgi:hypothetical protein